MISAEFRKDPSGLRRDLLEFRRDVYIDQRIWAVFWTWSSKADATLKEVHNLPPQNAMNPTFSHPPHIYSTSTTITCLMQVDAPDYHCASQICTHSLPLRTIPSTTLSGCVVLSISDH
ncbi:hypothetical protein M758_UG267900 [Ceratodon purpureus]|nr:hypothetical protein M758_UG267900 [Ceratodon purpureus]